MHWDSDPELKSLRDDFIASFQKRRTTLVANSLALKGSGASLTSTQSGPAYEIRVVAHNLSGAAGSYGFPRLGQLATLLDDYLSLSRQEIRVDRLLAFAGTLIEALKAAESLKDDCPLPDSTEYQELTSCVESLGAEASS